MHCITYISDYVPSSNNPNIDILNISSSAKRKNPKLNVTGVLFFHNNQFLQIIEGEKENLEILMKTIEKDKRHKNIQVIFNTKITERSFPDWNMDAFNIDEKRSVRETIIEFKKIFTNLINDLEPAFFIECLKEFLNRKDLQPLVSA